MKRLEEKILRWGNKKSNKQNYLCFNSNLLLQLKKRKGIQTEIGYYFKERKQIIPKVFMVR
jgi:hypothetical protein